MDPRRGGFYGQHVELNAIAALTKYQGLWQLLGVAGPLMVGLTLSGVKGWRILSAMSDVISFNAHEETLDRDVILIPELLVQDPVMSATAMLQPVFDLMWNGGGWPRSPSYSGPGVLRAQGG